MDVERSDSKITATLIGKERFKTRITAAPGNTRILVDTITLEAAKRDKDGVKFHPDTLSVDGGLKNLFFGFSNDPECRTGETSWGPDVYKQAMPDAVYVAIQGLMREVAQL